MRQHHLFIISFFVLTFVLAGCGKTPATPTSLASEAPATTEPQQPVASTATLTPDPCSAGQIEAEVQKVHKHMREFDDASDLASHTTRDQIGGSISDLQRIRREAEDETIPACLLNLKTYQIQHMNTVIQTFLAFKSGVDQQSINEGLTLGRQQHDQYVLEFARLLGMTIVPATAPGLPSETPTP